MGRGDRAAVEFWMHGYVTTVTGAHWRTKHLEVRFYSEAESEWRKVGAVAHLFAALFESERETAGVQGVAVLVECPTMNGSGSSMLCKARIESVEHHPSRGDIAAVRRALTCLADEAVRLLRVEISLAKESV